MNSSAYSLHLLESVYHGAVRSNTPLYFILSGWQLSEAPRHFQIRQNWCQTFEPLKFNTITPKIIATLPKTSTNVAQMFDTNFVWFEEGGGATSLTSVWLVLMGLTQDASVIQSSERSSPFICLRGTQYGTLSCLSWFHLQALKDI